jgi:hypothetical protein
MTAARSAAPALQLVRPPFRAISRETVDGLRPICTAIAREEAPAAAPREISSRCADES